jgi:hypothetical protein
LFPFATSSTDGGWLIGFGFTARSLAGWIRRYDEIREVPLADTFSFLGDRGRDRMDRALLLRFSGHGSIELTAGSRGWLLD